MTKHHVSLWLRSASVKISLKVEQVYKLFRFVKILRYD